MKVQIWGLEYKEVSMVPPRVEFTLRTFKVTDKSVTDDFCIIGEAQFPNNDSYIKLSENTVAKLSLDMADSLYSEVLNYSLVNNENFPIRNLLVSYQYNDGVDGDPVKWSLRKVATKCECGAQKALKIEDFRVGHSFWCPVYKES